MLTARPGSSWRPANTNTTSRPYFWTTFLDRGCEGPSYSPIVGSGPNGAILHYMSNQRRMDRGELVVIDAAAQCDAYASDITRTLPVGGKFTPRQREIYQVVLGAQQAAIAAVKPDAWLSGTGESLTKIARDYIDAHGKDLHGEPLGKYFTHDIGHQVGLQVHDARVDGPLEAGMVITIEPGIYIAEEHLGVRIEDVVLVTPNGAKVLSAALPKEPDEIEKAVVPVRRTLGYVAVLAVTLAAAIVLGWTALAAQIDDDAYDWMFRLSPPAAIQPHSVILAIDDPTFSAMGGVRAQRTMLAGALELLARRNRR